MNKSYAISGVAAKCSSRDGLKHGLANPRSRTNILSTEFKRLSNHRRR